MNDQEKIKLLENTLKFYADENNYWGVPIPLNSNLDRRTLSIVAKAHLEREILNDFGQRALNALNIINLHREEIK